MVLYLISKENDSPFHLSYFGGNFASFFDAYFTEHSKVHLTAFGARFSGNVSPFKDALRVEVPNVFGPQPIPLRLERLLGFG